MCICVHKFFLGTQHNCNETWKASKRRPGLATNMVRVFDDQVFAFRRLLVVSCLVTSTVTVLRVIRVFAIMLVQRIGSETVFLLLFLSSPNLINRGYLVVLY